MDADMVDDTGDDPEDGAAPASVGATADASADLDTEADSGEVIDPQEVGEADTIGAAEEAVEHDLAALLAERNQFKDIALRLQADFENYRKRITAQQGDEIDRATGRLVTSLLGVLDACEAAFSHGVEGVEPIWSKLLGELQRQGLEAMDLQGRPFEPAEAEAVLHEPGDGGVPEVVEVLRTGYRWKGKVLRAAMVKVKG